MYQTLVTELHEGILTITINRPEKLNALNSLVLQELDKVLDQMESHREIKAAIITGSGIKSFVAGADISEFSGLSSQHAAALALRGQELFFRIERNAKPIVAAVNGFALGGGCELAMACHFRMASYNAKFGQPEVNLGIMPGYGGTQRMVQLVGKGRAMELVLSGNMIDAEEAHRIGLVNHLYPVEDLLDKTKALRQTILSEAPLAIAASIKALNAVFEPRVDGYEVEANAFGHCFATKDMEEGTAAFLEKRKPVFKGE